MKESSIAPTVGRILNVFNPEHWDGVRPGIVTSVASHNTDSDGDEYTVAVNVFMDCILDSDSAPVISVIAHLYDAATEDERLALIGANPDVYPVWAEWMPYQQGQAAKTAETEGTLKSYVKALARDIDRIHTALSRLPGGVDALNGVRDGAIEADATVSTPADIGRVLDSDGTTEATAGAPQSPEEPVTPEPNPST